MGHDDESALDVMGMFAEREVTDLYDKIAALKEERDALYGALNRLATVTGLAVQAIVEDPSVVLVRAEAAEAERDAARNALEALEHEHRDCGMDFRVMTGRAEKAEAERDDARIRVDSLEAILISVRMQVQEAEAERDALRTRIEEAPVAWIWTDHICNSREEMHRLIGGRWATEDVERVRLVPEPEVTP